MDLHFSGNYTNQTGGEVVCNLTVITFEEDGVYFVYAPAMDLTGYGESLEEAKSSFEQTLEQFVNYGMNKNTFFRELKKLGWKISKKKASVPPSLVDMINKNEYLARIFEEKQYTKSHQNISLPAYG
jgi:hypothetical protein